MDSAIVPQDVGSMVRTWEKPKPAKTGNLGSQEMFWIAKQFKIWITKQSCISKQLRLTNSLGSQTNIAPQSTHFQSVPGPPFAEREDPWRPLCRAKSRLPSPRSKTATEQRSNNSRPPRISPTRSSSMSSGAGSLSSSKRSSPVGGNDESTPTISVGNSTKSKPSDINT